jgi:hypothetical protein
VGSFQVLNERRFLANRIKPANKKTTMTTTIVEKDSSGLAAVLNYPSSKGGFFDNPASHHNSRFQAVQMVRHVPLLLLEALRGTRRLVE